MENDHAYLCLPKIIVKKEEVGYLLTKYDKIEIQKGLNNLKNPNVVKVIPYYYIDFNDLLTIIEKCKFYKKLQIPILSGIVFSKVVRHLSYKTIRKLMEIEEDRNIDLSISKDIRNKMNSILFKTLINND